MTSPAGDAQLPGCVARPGEGPPVEGEAVAQLSAQDGVEQGWVVGEADEGLIGGRDSRLKRRDGLRVVDPEGLVE